MQVFFLKEVEASITTFNMNNGDMNMTGWRGRINRVKIIKNKIVWVFKKYMAADRINGVAWPQLFKGSIKLSTG